MKIPSNEIRSNEIRIRRELPVYPFRLDSISYLVIGPPIIIYSVAKPKTLFVLKKSYLVNVLVLTQRSFLNFITLNKLITEKERGKNNLIR